MIGMLGSLLGSQGGRMLGGMIGGRTGAMIGGMAGALIGGKRLGGALGGIKNMLDGDGGEDRGEDKGEGSASGFTDDQSLTEAEAQILIRLMVNAAKADGHVDQAEIDAIVGELNDVSDEERQFLTEELASPFIEPASMAEVVPRDLAVDAYVVSVAAIKVDTGHEADYLRRFAAGVGLDDDTLGAIHDDLQLPHL